MNDQTNQSPRLSQQEIDQINHLTRKLTRNILDAAQCAMPKRAFEKYRLMIFRMTFQEYQQSLFNLLDLETPQHQKGRGE